MKHRSKKMMKKVFDKRKRESDYEENDSDTFSRSKVKLCKSKNITRLCGATKKSIFRSREEACDFLRANEIKTRMRIYQCEYCNQFHFTSKAG